MATHKRTVLAPGKSPARRNLFGPINREQLRAECREALRRDLEEATQRWGFDFLLDEPLESSDFRWECIPGAEVPLPYRSCTLGVRRAGAAVRPPPKGAVPPTGGRVGSPQNDKENITCSPERWAPNQEDLEKTPERRGNTGPKRKQTNITDFYQAKRRVVGMPRKSGE